MKMGYALVVGEHVFLRSVVPGRLTDAYVLSVGGLILREPIVCLHVPSLNTTVEFTLDKMFQVDLADGWGLGVYQAEDMRVFYELDKACEGIHTL